MKLTDDEAHYLSTIVRSQVMTPHARVRLLEVIEDARVFAASPKLQLAVACERWLHEDGHHGRMVSAGDEQVIAHSIRRYLGGEPVEVVREAYGWTVRALGTEVSLG